MNYVACLFLCLSVMLVIFVGPRLEKATHTAHHAFLKFW